MSLTTNHTMSGIDEKEWFRKNVSDVLDDPLRRIKGVGDSLGRLEGNFGDTSAQLILIKRLESATQTLSTAADAWVSHNADLVRIALGMQEESLRLQNTRGSLAERITELRDAKSLVESCLESEKSRLALEGSVAMLRLNNQLLSSQNELLETQKKLRDSETVVSAQRDEIAALKERCRNLEVGNSRLTGNVSRTHSNTRVVAVDLPERTAESSILEGRRRELEDSRESLSRSRQKQDLRPISAVPSPTSGRAEKRRRLDEISTEEESMDECQSRSEHSTSLSLPTVAMIPQTGFADVSATKSLVSGAITAPVEIDQIRSAPLPSALPTQTAPWVLIDFGGDQALEDEFKQLFSSWTVDEMIAKFDEVCLVKNRTRPEKTCLTVKFFGTRGQRSQFDRGDMDTGLRANCPTHETSPGSCMRLAFLDGTESTTPYISGQQRYCVRLRN